VQDTLNQINLIKSMNKLYQSGKREQTEHRQSYNYSRL